MLLTLGLVLLNVFRRRRIARAADEGERIILPTLREDLLWGALVVAAGGAGLGVILWLLMGAHTARSLLVAAICGLMMLLGLVMLLKNGLAPTDVLRLEDAAPASELPVEALDEDERAFEQAQWGLYRGRQTDSLPRIPSGPIF